MEYLHQTKMKEEIAEEVKKCHFCDKEFPQNTLDQHFVLHHLNVNTCPNCKFFANSKEVLMMHLKNFHENQKTQPMEEIITDEQHWIVESEINSILNNLTEENIEDMETKYSRVQKKVDSGFVYPKIHDTQMQEEYKCHICNEKIPQNTLEQHIAQNHLNVVKKEENKCAICGALFKNKLTLKIHFAAIHDGKQFNCHICSKSFQTSKLLTFHLDQHFAQIHLKVVKCAICGELFKNSFDLKIHFDSVHGGQTEMDSITKRNEDWFNTILKPQKQKPCTETWTLNPKPTAYKKEANKSIEEDEKQFNCDLCSKSFQTLQILTFHKKILHREQIIQHECNPCGKTFPEKFSSQIFVNFRRFSISKS